MKGKTKWVEVKLFKNSLDRAQPCHTRTHEDNFIFILGAMKSQILFSQRSFQLWCLEEGWEEGKGRCKWCTQEAIATARRKNPIKLSGNKDGEK